MMKEHCFRHRFDFLFVLLALFAAVAACLSVAWGDDRYRATADGNLLQVRTPGTTRVFFGEPGFGDLRGYRLEIPLNELEPDRDGGEGGSGNGHGHSERTPNPSINDDVDQLFAHANQLYQQGKFEAAMEFVQEILRRDPNQVRAWVMKGSLLHAQENRAGAKEAWKKAQVLDPNDQMIKNILENYQ